MTTKHSSIHLASEGSFDTTSTDSLAEMRSLVAEYQQDPNGAVLDDWEPREGTIVTEVRAISARINQNFDAWPSEELKAAHHTFVGKPVFINHHNHDPDRARGRVVASRYVDAGEHDRYVQVLQEVEASRFPMLAKELMEGGLDSVSMGAEAREVECSYCANVSTSPFDACEHIPLKGSYLQRRTASGTKEDVLVYEICRKISFFELSYVFEPADETAVASNVLVANRHGLNSVEVPPKVDTLHPDEDEKSQDDWQEFVDDPNVIDTIDVLDEPDLGLNQQLERADDDIPEGFEEFADVDERIEENERAEEELAQESREHSQEKADAEAEKAQEQFEQAKDPEDGENWDEEDDGTGGTTYSFKSAGFEAMVANDYGTFNMQVEKNGQLIASDAYANLEEAKAAAVEAVRNNTKELKVSWPSRSRTSRRVTADEWGDKINQELASNGGFSFREHPDNKPSSGYMVAVAKERPAGTGENVPDDVRQFMQENSALLSKPDHYMGGWEENGRLIMDVSLNVQDLEEAVALGLANNQRAIYDVVNKRDINLDQYRESRRRNFRLRKAGTFDGCRKVANSYETDHGTLTMDGNEILLDGEQVDYLHDAPDPDTDDVREILRLYDQYDRSSSGGQMSFEDWLQKTSRKLFANFRLRKAGTFDGWDTSMGIATYDGPGNYQLWVALEYGSEGGEDWQWGDWKVFDGFQEVASGSAANPEVAALDAVMAADGLGFDTTSVPGSINTTNASRRTSSTDNFRSWVESAGLSTRNVNQENGGFSFSSNAGQVKVYETSDGQVAVEAGGGAPQTFPKGQKKSIAKEIARFDPAKLFPDRLSSIVDNGRRRTAAFDEFRDLLLDYGATDDVWDANAAELMATFESLIDLHAEMGGDTTELEDGLADLQFDSGIPHGGVGYYSRRNGGRRTSRTNNRATSRRSNRMTPQRRRRIGDNKQTPLLEDTGIAQTPAEEPAVDVETGGDAPNNSESDRVKSARRALRREILRDRARKARRRTALNTSDMSDFDLIEMHGELENELQDGSDDESGVIRDMNYIQDEAERRGLDLWDPNFDPNERAFMSRRRSQARRRQAAPVGADLSGANVNREDLFEDYPATTMTARIRKRFANWVGENYGASLRQASSQGELRSWARAFSKESGIELSRLHAAIKRDIQAFRTAEDKDEDIPDFIEEKIESDEDNPSKEDVDDAEDDKKESRRRAAIRRRAAQARNVRGRRTRTTRRRTADDKLDLAAPDDRVNVEKPTSGTTDADAQASQFDKADFDNNSGKGLENPDTTGTPGIPGGPSVNDLKKSARASGLQAVQLAEAMIAVGLIEDSREAKFKAAAQFEQMSRDIVLDRTALLEKVATKQGRRSSNQKSAGNRGASLNSAVPPNMTGVTRKPAPQAREASSANDSDLFF